MLSVAVSSFNLFTLSSALLLRPARRPQEGWVDPLSPSFDWEELGDREDEMRTPGFTASAATTPPDETRVCFSVFII